MEWRVKMLSEMAKIGPKKKARGMARIKPSHGSNGQRDGNPVPCHGSRMLETVFQIASVRLLLSDT